MNLLTMATSSSVDASDDSQDSHQEVPTSKQNGGTDDRTNLIVNYLPQTLTDCEFQDMFGYVGPICLQKTKIMRDRRTGYSFGYGFVEYDRHEDAVKAIKALNGCRLQTKTMKVAFARPQGEQTKNTNLYMRGLPKAMSTEELLALFEGYGGIVQCKTLKDKNGCCTGCGFVLFEGKEGAEKAVEELQGKRLPGATETLNIQFAEESCKKVRPPVPPCYQRGPYYGGPPPPGRGTRGPGYGPPPRLPGPGRYHPMFGLVPPTSPEGPGHVVYVYNIGPYAHEHQLRDLFSLYGQVTKVDVIWDHQKNMSKNYGFVTFAHYREAHAAIQDLDGRYYMVKDRPLQVSFKTTKSNSSSTSSGS